MIIAPHLRQRLARFKRSETGNINVELVTMVPLLLIVSLGLISFFHAFKAKTTAARTATVISDVVSRETKAITPNFLDGISGVMQSMINSDEAPEYRLTAFSWDANDNLYRVQWSKERGERLEHTDQTLNGLSQKLPSLKNGQRAMLLETWVDYEPLTNFGLEQGTTFVNRLVAAPRFTPQLCYLSSEDADITTALC